MYLVITIDVEPDCSLSWLYSNPLTFDGVQIGIGEKLQPLFNKYNICPTYLINNVVMEDAKSVSVLLNLKGHFELGAHLHPEFIEPQKKYFDYSNKRGEMNECYLHEDVEFGKIKNITELFYKSFNRKPLSFRAGRFSAGVNTIKSLKKLGYKVDTSVTPHINWNDETRELPVDYSQAFEQPYFIAEDSILGKCDSDCNILEVPVSIAKIKKIFRNEKLIWLRPVYSTYEQMIDLIKHYQKKYKHYDFIVVNMMFHNIELIPGKSPYTKSEEECREYMKLLEKFMVFCLKERIESVNLSKLYDISHDKKIKKN
ncbi:MAG: hypothetical protein AB1498_10315 [bacterium]